MRIGVLICVMAVLMYANPAGAADVPFGDLEIRYDETPVFLGGQMQWKGSVRIPLSRNTDSQALTGQGNYSFSYGSKEKWCLVNCTASVPVTVEGKALLGGLAELNVRFGGASANCTVFCPELRRGAQGFRQNQEAYTESLRLSTGGEAVRRQPQSPGPAEFYALIADCPVQGDGNLPLPVSVLPGQGKWEVTPLLMMTLDDVRKEPPADPRRLGWTRFPRFNDGAAASTIKMLAAREGVCYWVENVTLTVPPIEFMLPGINWGEGSCEYRAIMTHERKHVDDAKGRLSTMSAAWIKGMRAAGLPTASRPARAMSAAEARATVDRRVNELTATLTDQALIKFHENAPRFDTPAEYAAVSASCPGGWRE